MKAKIAPRITLKGRTKLETVIPLSTPYLVFLDPSDICNAKCAWCPTGSGEAKKYKKPQLMDYILYRKIIDDLAAMPESIKVLRLYGDGEPLLNPCLPDMIQYAKHTGRFRQIDTTSNGILLNEFFMVPNLIGAGLDKIFISVPRGYTAEYVKSVRKMYERGRDRCHVLVKIIGDGLSNAAKEKFMRDFGDIADSIFIENLSPCWLGLEVEGVNQEKGIYGQPLTPAPMVCPYPFYSVKINSDGSVSLCFLDYPHRMIIGDLKSESFKDIWNGEILRKYQVMHLSGKRDTHPFCSKCRQLVYGMPDVLDPYADEILKKLLDK